MITKGKDLRTGAPVWSAYRQSVIKPQTLAQREEADVLVVGAGISGAMIAEQLTAAGLSVIILDRREAVQGSTRASTSLLIYEIDTPLIKLADKIGTTKAVRAWRRSRLGLDGLVSKIHALAIPCNIEYRDSLYLSGNVLDAAGLNDEMKMRNMVGLPTVYVSQGQLKSTYDLSRRAALQTFGNIAVDPVKLANGFLKAALDKGARLYSPVTVEDIEYRKNGIVARTDENIMVHAKYLVYATGYEIPKQIKTRRHRVCSTWVIATKPQPNKLWPSQCFIWEASDPYLYLRTTPDGRVVCGGGDEPFSDEDHRDALLERKTRYLENRLGKMFPQLDPQADYAWTGSFGSSTTGLPSIGPIPGYKNCYAVMAYGGNGIVFSRIAADMIAASICGYADPDEDLFAFYK